MPRKVHEFRITYISKSVQYCYNHPIGMPTTNPHLPMFRFTRALIISFIIKNFMFSQLSFLNKNSYSEKLRTLFQSKYIYFSFIQSIITHHFSFKSDSSISLKSLCPSSDIHSVKALTCSFLSVSFSFSFESY